MRVEGSVSTATARNNQRAKEGGRERRKRESERSRCSQTVLVLWASPSPTLLTNVERAVTGFTTSCSRMLTWMLKKFLKSIKRIKKL